MMSHAGSLAEGQRCCTVYKQRSHTVNLTNIPARTDAIDVGRVLGEGNSSLGHNHPIPCLFHMRSKASRKTFGMDKGRPTKACWHSVGGSYLVRGSAASTHSRDLSVTSMIPLRVKRMKEDISKTKHTPRIQSPCGRGSPRYHVPTTLPTPWVNLTPQHSIKLAGGPRA